MPSIDLLKGDYNRGWLIARNPRRALNQLSRLKNCSKIAEKLYLSYESDNKEIVDSNFEILQEHQRGSISTGDSIRHIHKNLKYINKSIEIYEINQLLKDIFPVSHMEFHPTDVCNLACCGCTYGHDRVKKKGKADVFPYDHIYKIKAMSPKSIVVVGGGEPTLYRDKNHGFNDIISKLRDLLPSVKLGLVTNGTTFPEGDWHKELDWARISLDAATKETFRNFRQKDFFGTVCNNLIPYIETSIKYVGVGFLYNKMNIFEYVQSIDCLYRFIKNRSPENLKKFNIQFRPLRQDPKDEGKDFPEAISQDDIDDTINRLLKLASSSDEMFDFIKNQTNTEVVEAGNKHKPLHFTRCHYSLIFHILRANGNLYPCFITVDQPDFCLGNLLKDSTETIALNTLFIAGKLHDICNPHQCRQCHINNILERGLTGELKPPASKDVQEDYFF